MFFTNIGVSRCIYKQLGKSTIHHDDIQRFAQTLSFLSSTQRARPPHGSILNACRQFRVLYDDLGPIWRLSNLHELAYRDRGRAVLEKPHENGKRKCPWVQTQMPTLSLCVLLCIGLALALEPTMRTDGVWGICPNGSTVVIADISAQMPYCSSQGFTLVPGARACVTNSITNITLLDETIRRAESEELRHFRASQQMQR